MGGHGASDPEKRDPLPEASGWNVLATLISGIILGVGLGWLLNRWVGSDLMYLVGLLAGTALAVYSVWVRYVRR
ncbi:AtpZ/AtpI family protein [Thalassiella azotivora]